MSKSTAKFIPWRFYLILFFISIIVLGLVGRIINLSVVNKKFLLAQGDSRVLRLVETPAFRGMIADRNGFPLAVSTTVFSVWVNPKELFLDSQDGPDLAKLLQLKLNDIQKLIKLKQNKEFLYIKRAVPPHIAAQIKALNVPGLYLQKEYRRYYPEGETAAQLVGFTNIDDKGQEGIELAYNQWLQGEQGKKWVIRDRLGREISDVDKIQDEKPGKDIALSIDRRIQYIAYQALVAGAKENNAESGSAVVLDVATGEILALANYPSFNPNNKHNVSPNAVRNRAITDLFEPGSTIKAFTVASALESEKYHMNSVVDTSPGWMRVDHNVVKDIKNNGALTLSQILQYSSNMGAAKLVLSMPPNQLWSLLHRVGFGEITGVGFPGEQNGVLTQHSPWGSFVLATLSFGYGMSSTALQLTRAYAVIANQGVKLPLSLLKLDQPPTGEQVIAPKISKEMLALLETVMLKGGSGQTIRVPGYRVAGKTGTSRRLGRGGYLKDKHNSSFVGIAPVSNPRLVISVIINNPQGKQYYGGLVSGPIFAKIMEGSLRALNIAPDAQVT